MTRWASVLLVAGLVGLLGACAAKPRSGPAPVSAAAPRYPDYPAPEIPPALAVTAVLKAQHDAAWTRLQTGDTRAASREFQAILKQSPAFYPAETGLGFALLASRDAKAADLQFASALARNARYVPALAGQAEAALAQNNLAGAISAMERLLVIDPKRDALRGRLELVKFRLLQALIEDGRKARQARRYDEAEEAFERALVLAPASAIILRDLALTEIARGALTEAEGHARRAIQAEPTDVEGHTILAGILESQERWRDASAAWARAAAIEPRPEWRARAEELSDRADMAALPAEYRELPTARTVSRGLAAAYLGIKLEALITKAPRRVTSVATDVRNHWAASWILPVTQAGVMDILPNHTFQPAGTLRRGELAQIATQLVTLAAAGRAADLTAWRAARPRFVDLSTGNVYYRAAAFAFASSAMTAEGLRFEATRPATGAELVAVVAHVERLARR